MTTLHLIRESSSQKDFSTYIDLIAPCDAIVLLDDGCYNVNTSWFVNLNVANKYIIEVHASARAIPLNTNINTIHTEALVDLVCQHDNSITWR